MQQRQPGPHQLGTQTKMCWCCFETSKRQTTATTTTTTTAGREHKHTHTRTDSALSIFIDTAAMMGMDILYGWMDAWVRERESCRLLLLLLLLENFVTFCV
jgi:hypothetical protein